MTPIAAAMSATSDRRIVSSTAEAGMATPTIQPVASDRCQALYAAVPSSVVDFIAPSDASRVRSKNCDAGARPMYVSSLRVRAMTTGV
jgi:hypothetical protein